MYLYEVGFDKLDELDDDTLERFYKLRESEIRKMMETQFILSYMANVSKADSDEMTPYELNNWVEILKKQKDLEVKREAKR
jgi:hypothetical protein